MTDFVSSSNDNYTYETNSNRLATSNTTTLSRDANGNTLNDGQHSYSYNAYNRLIGVDANVTYNTTPWANAPPKTSAAP